MATNEKGTGRPGWEFVRNSGPLALVVLLAWLLATFFYLLGARPHPSVTEHGVSELVRQLDEIESAGPGRAQDRRNLLLAHLVGAAHGRFFEGLFLHLAIALFVGGGLVLVVDIVTRHMTRQEFRRYRDEVAADVWRAIFRRSLPEKVSEELENMTKHQVAWLKPHFTVLFPRSAYTGIPPGYVVARRQLHYPLLNLVHGPVSHPVRISVISHAPDVTVPGEKGAPVSLPCIRALKVDGRDITIAPGSKEMVHNVDLPRMASEIEAVEVLSELDELYEVGDRAIHILGRMSDGVQLTVMNEIRDQIEVQWDKVYLTSGREKLRPTSAATMVYEGGILPGTAVVVSWRPAATGRATAGTVDPNR